MPSRHGGGIRRAAMLCRSAMWALAILLICVAPALAGPPYITDDPEPTDFGHWEIYNFAYAIDGGGETGGQAGFDINYGAAKDLQLTLVAPIDFESGEAVGPGDIELAAKYGFLHQAPGTWTPDVALFPRLFVPTAPDRFGPPEFSLLLPVWAQDWGKWSFFGGGGYDINLGPGKRDFWLTGLGLSREVSDRLALGAEFFHQTADVEGARAFTGLNAGAIYKLTDHWSLLLSAGPGIENSRQEDRYDVYLALEATY